MGIYELNSPSNIILRMRTLIQGRNNLTDAWANNGSKPGIRLAAWLIKPIGRLEAAEGITARPILATNGGFIAA